jgi:hypothetical protein
MTDEDYGSGRALGSAVLLMAAGILISAGTWFGYQDGLRQPPVLIIGVVVGGYFLVAGSVRVAVGLLTRRAGR